MAEIAKRLNMEVEYQNTSWDAMIQAVSEKQYDLGMTGITIKDERKEKVDFSDSYMTNQIYMLVRGDETRFTDPATFKADENLLIGAQAGTSPFYVGVYEVLDGNEANPRIKLFETFGAQVQALQTGDVDLVLTDGTAGEGYARASDGKLKLIGSPMGEEDFGFIFPKGSDLVAPGERRGGGDEGGWDAGGTQQEVVPGLYAGGVRPRYSASSLPPLSSRPPLSSPRRRGPTSPFGKAARLKIEGAATFRSNPVGFPKLTGGSPPSRG